MPNETVLVTGGSGFLGAHCTAALLRDGYNVHTTIRTPSREAEVREMMSNAGIDAEDRLRFFVADLGKNDGWPEAADGCDFVLHVASPFPLGVPKHEDDLIVPAREGALRVLRAARDAGVKRVVMTSSFAAIGYGHHGQTTPFTEKDWSILSDRVEAYPKSKTIAERAAWDFIENEGNGLELAVINPVGIFGPGLGRDTGTSLEIVNRILFGNLPALPNIRIGAVDVRDVAGLHLLAMTRPEAAGERFIAACNGKTVSMPEIAGILRDNLGAKAAHVTTRTMPDFAVRLMRFFSPQIKQIAGELGRYREASSAKARETLGWDPRSAEESILASAHYLLALRKDSTASAA